MRFELNGGNQMNSQPFIASAPNCHRGIREDGAFSALFVPPIEDFCCLVQSIKLCVEDLFVFAEAVLPACPAGLPAAQGILPAYSWANPWRLNSLLPPPYRRRPTFPIIRTEPVRPEDEGVWL